MKKKLKIANPPVDKEFTMFQSELDELRDRAVMEGRRIQFEKDVNLCVDFSNKMLERAEQLEGARILQPQQNIKFQQDHLRACSQIAIQLKDAMITLNTGQFKEVKAEVEAANEGPANDLS